MNVRQIQSGSFVSDDDPGEPATGEKRVSVTGEEGRLLAFLVQGKRVIEIGTGLGVSTDFMATHARRVVTVDNDPWVWANVWPELRQTHHNRVLTLADRAHVTGMFDVGFVDGNHTTHDAQLDIAFCAEHIRHGMILVHDAKIEAVSLALHRHQELDFHDVDTTHGISVAFSGWEF